jgi:glycosyltransferase involved in cell wall biosynthesis
VALLLNLAPRKLGSMEAWLQDLAVLLRERGHAVTVFCRDPIHPEIADDLDRAGVERESLDRLRAQPVRSVLRLRDFDVLHLSFLSPTGRIAFLSFLAWPARVLVVDHISRVRADSNRVLDATSRLRTMLGRGKTRLVSLVARSRLAGIAAVSHYVRSEARKSLRIPSDRIRTIYNGVDSDRFRPVESRELRPHRIAIISVAHLIPEKGVHHLLAAVAALGDPRLTITIVGDGPERARLESRAVSLGIADQAEFLGLRDDVDELLRESDLFVHPAVWGEAFGLTIAEAMASGCAVVASDVGGIPELIESGVTGLLVPPADEVALRGAIARLIDDRELRMRLSERARSRVIERFSLEACVRAHADWCEAIG